ncbi:MAG: murein biosynthesis integral membrane protein MurJ [Actinomycetota bacterium]
MDRPEMTAPPVGSPQGSEGASPKSLVRASAVMSIGTILSRVTGLLRLIAITAALGVAEGRLADSYNLANMVPNLLYYLILGGILAAVFVPVFVELLEKEGRDKAWETASALINVVLIVLTGVTILGILAAPWIAEFYAARLEGQEGQAQQEALTFLMRLLIPQIVFYGLSAMVTGLLNAHKRFGAPMYTPVLGNIAVIIVFIGFHRAYGEVGLDASSGQLSIIGLGTTLGVALMAVAQLPFLRGLGRYRLTISLRDPSIRKVARLSMFVMAYMLVTQLGYLFIQWLANGQQGGYSAYIAAYTFYLLPISLFVLSVTTALLPDMSSHAVHARWDEFRDRFSLGIRATVFLVLPAAAGYLVIGRPMIEVLLENGVMTAQSIDLVWEVLALMALGLPQGAVFTFLIRAFYSMQDTKSPFLIVSVVTALHAAINFPLFEWMGVAGIALGQTLVHSVGIVVGGRALGAKIGGIDAARIRQSALRVLFATVSMAAVVWVIHRGLDEVLSGAGTPGQVLNLASSVTSGVVAYLALAHALHVEELQYIRRLFGTRLARARGGPDGPPLE